MRRLLRIALGLVLVLSFLGAGAAFWWREELTRLWAVNTLFDEDRIVANFSDMQGLFFSRVVPKAGETLAWPVEPVALPASYRWDGQEKPVEEWLARTATTSLVVIRDGVLVHEQYRLGTGPEDRRISWSMAKSFLSAMFGAPVTEGRIELDKPVDAYVPMLKGSVYEGVTVRNVLNMASGVRFNEDYLDFNSDINRMGRILAIGGSMDEFAAGLEGRERRQGEKRQYTSIDTHVLGMVLRAVTGKDLPELMAETLWAQLGAEADAYYLTDRQGVAFALGGLNMRSRDYARFGQMMLDGGSFAGRQVVPQAWALESVRASAPPSASTLDPFGYGYQWWVPVDADDEFYAIGIYGQYIYVSRKARIVIVKTSADRQFMADGAFGSHVEAETIALFRSLAGGLTGWTPPASGR